MNAAPCQFLWFDSETTGLDAEKCTILEVAAVVCDDSDPAMPVLDQYTAVVHCDRPEYAFADPFVREMHTKNGLWEACAQSELSLAGVEQGLLAFVYGFASKFPLAGATISFDRAFLKKHMPKFESALHYRNFDVSTLKAAERNWGGGFADIKGEKHRALDDILATIAEARAIRALRWAK